MPSAESLREKRKLQKEQVDPRVSLAEERQTWDEYASELPIADGVSLENVVLDGVPCLWLHPSDNQTETTVLYAHGGGLTTGSVVTHRSFASEFAKSTGFSVLLVDYRLLPEHSVAAPMEDFRKVFCELSLHYRDKNQKIFFGGDSSGAAVVLSAMISLRNSGNALPEGWFSISGAVDATLSGDSHTTKEDTDPMLSQAVLRHWQRQVAQVADLNAPELSPLFGDLSGLPPALLIAGEDEVWLDDTTRLHTELLHAGSSSDMHIFEGMWHVWPMTAGLPETAAAFSEISGFIRTTSKQNH